mgnify:CR=1 FL=1
MITTFDGKGYHGEYPIRTDTTTYYVAARSPEMALVRYRQGIHFLTSNVHCDEGERVFRVVVETKVEVGEL